MNKPLLINLILVSFFTGCTQDIKSANTLLEESKRRPFILAEEFIRNLGIQGSVKQCTRMHNGPYNNNFGYTNCTIKVIFESGREEILSIDCDLPSMTMTTPGCIIAKGY